MGEMEVFHVGGRKRPKGEKKPVRQNFTFVYLIIFHSNLFSSSSFNLESQQAAKMTFAFEAISVKRLMFKAEKV